MPTPESLWNMHIGTKQVTDPPTPPSSTIPTPEALWETNLGKAAPPPTPPPTEPVSPDSVWAPSAAKKQPVKQMPVSADANTTKRGGKSKAEKQTASDSLWDPRAASVPPEPVAALPTHTGNSVESAHNHGYMSPLLIELECDEFPLASQDILTDELVEESIRQWHQQAAEADIQLRRQLVSTHWERRDWDELLGSHVQEMEHYARTVVGHWKDICEAEKARRSKEDKQRRLAGIRNVTSGNRRWGPSNPVEATPFPAPALASASIPTKARSPEPVTKAQQPRKGAGRKYSVTVEDATSSEWEERSSTPSLSSDKSKTRPNESPEYDTPWQKEAPAAKAAPGLMSNMWGKSATTTAEAQINGARKKPVDGNTKSAFSPAEPIRNTGTPLPWDDPQSRRPEKSLWDTAGSAAAEDDDSANGSPWSQGAASAWSFAMNAIGGDKSAAPTKLNGKPPMEPPVNRTTSFWSSGDTNSRSMSQGPSQTGFGDASLDGRFTPWKPSRAAVDPEAEANDPTKKMADLALQHLYETADVDDSDELHNAMSMYTKAVASSTRKRAMPTAKAYVPNSDIRSVPHN